MWLAHRQAHGVAGGGELLSAIGQVRQRVSKPAPQIKMKLLAPRWLRLM